MILPSPEIYILIYILIFQVPQVSKRDVHEYFSVDLLKLGCELWVSWENINWESGWGGGRRREEGEGGLQSARCETSETGARNV